MFHPSGGLIYHLRALRFRRNLWMPFHAHVLRWITDWRPATDQLVLVGPSGGYALSSQFLARFDKVTIIEPDPLARLILRRRFPFASFELDGDSSLAMPGGLGRLAVRHPHAAILFCNLLGQQLIGEPRGFDRRSWLAQLAPALTGQPWASWHDIISTEDKPRHFERLSRPHADPIESVCSHFWSNHELEVHDHNSYGLCPDRARQYAIWAMTPREFHLVEWVSQGG